MAPDQPVVAIFDGDPVVREALEVLLQAAGYRTRFLRIPVGDELDEALPDFHLYHLLLIAPELSAEHRKALLDMTSSQVAPAKIPPTLELLPEGAEPKVRGGRVMPWPCSIEELKRAIEAILLGQG